MSNLTSLRIDYPWKHVINTIDYPYNLHPKLEKYCLLLDNLLYSQRPRYKTSRGTAQIFQLHKSLDGMENLPIDAHASPFGELHDYRSLWKMWLMFFKEVVVDHHLPLIYNEQIDESELSVNISWFRDKVTALSYQGLADESTIMRTMFYVNKARPGLSIVELHNSNRKYALEYMLTPGLMISYDGANRDNYLRVACVDNIDSPDRTFIENQYFWFMFDIKRKT